MIQQHREFNDLPEESGRTPNDLDQTDESQNAADITRAGAKHEPGRASANPTIDPFPVPRTAKQRDVLLD